MNLWLQPLKTEFPKLSQSLVGPRHHLVTKLPEELARSLGVRELPRGVASGPENGESSAFASGGGSRSKACPSSTGIIRLGKSFLVKCFRDGAVSGEDQVFTEVLTGTLERE